MCVALRRGERRGERERKRSKLERGEVASEWCMIVSTAGLQNRAEHGVSVLCIRFRKRGGGGREGEGEEGGANRKSAVSRGNTLAGIDARAMGITRVQINFGES